MDKTQHDKHDTDYTKILSLRQDQNSILLDLKTSKSAFVSQSAGLGLCVVGKVNPSADKTKLDLNNQKRVIYRLTK